MQNDNTLKEPEDGEAYREMEISDALTLRVYADRMILDMPDPDEPTTFIPVATISSVDGMELAVVGRVGYPRLWEYAQLVRV